MLDVATLRVAFGVVAVTSLALSYVGPYRTTRSAYCLWWCVGLMLFMVSAVLFLFDGTAAQVIANPTANALGTLGTACVWAAARSLRHKATSAWQLGTAPVVVLAASFLDDPVHDVWTGGTWLLLAMSGLLALTSGELWALVPRRRGTSDEGPRYAAAVTSLALLSTLLSAFYAARTVAFVAVGPDHPFFTTFLGGGPTTLLLMTLAVAVSFSMSTVTYVHDTSELRSQAIRDGLTGVLNRTELMRRAELVRTGAHPAETALVVADLDGFKALNDGFGHAAGDQALVAFADACRSELGPDDLLGRLGGDEFALVIRDGGRAESVAAAISRRYEAGPEDQPTPTISFGIVSMDRGLSVKDTIIRADVALYQAKAAGRDRAFRYDGSRR